MIMTSVRVLLTCSVFMSVAGCEQRSPLVYVLESPQSVTLLPAASASSVEQGGTVVLRVQRNISGKWQQIPRHTLSAGQCWVYRPPPASETEVADNVDWEVRPADSIRFNGEFRLDHTRIATMLYRGRISVTPVSAVTCEPDRVVRGPTIEIEVF